MDFPFIKIELFIEGDIINFIFFSQMGCVFFKSGSDKISPADLEFFSFKIKDINGKLINFARFKSKKAFMVVNVACK
jgi:hypothetical protein